MGFKGEVRVRVRVGILVSELVGRVRVRGMIEVDESPRKDRNTSVCV